MPKFYVYQLCYPPELNDGACFYIGKGKAARVHSHEVDAARGQNGPRANAIRAIWAAGYQVVKKQVFWSDDEAEALQEEKRLIAISDHALLTNLAGVVRYQKVKSKSKKQRVVAFEDRTSFKTGNEIRAIRKSWGMSQQVFATEMGVSFRWLWDIEAHNKTPELLYQRALRYIIDHRVAA